MAETTTEQKTIEEQVVTILRTLPPERTQEVLDFAIFIGTRYATRIEVATDGDTKWDDIFSNKHQAEIEDWATKVLGEDEPTTGIATDGNELRPAP